MPTSRRLCGGAGCSVPPFLLLLSSATSCCHTAPRASGGQGAGPTEPLLARQLVDLVAAVRQRSRRLRGTLRASPCATCHTRVLAFLFCVLDDSLDSCNGAPSNGSPVSPLFKTRSMVPSLPLVDAPLLVRGIHDTIHKTKDKWCQIVTDIILGRWPSRSPQEWDPYGRVATSGSSDCPTISTLCEQNAPTAPLSSYSETAQIRPGLRG